MAFAGQDCIIKSADLGAQRAYDIVAEHGSTHKVLTRCYTRQSERSFFVCFPAFNHIKLITNVDEEFCLYTAQQGFTAEPSAV